MNLRATTRDFLHNGVASLAVVRMDPQGKPDSVSYWKNTGTSKTEQHKSTYEPGILVDFWI